MSQEREPGVFKVTQGDFFNCWKALTFMERGLTGAIATGNIPPDSSKEELEGAVAELRATREVIEVLLGKDPDRVH